MKHLVWLSLFCLLAGTVLQAQEPAVQGAINKLDNLGMKQGKWTKNFPTGLKRYEGSFLDDQPFGTFVYFYNERGSKKLAEVVYRAPGDTADARFYHPNGLLMGEGLFYNQQKVGAWKTYDKREVLCGIEHYDNGVQSGKAQYFFVEGSLAGVFMYKDGKRNGPSTEYFKDGTVRVTANYVDGNFDGEVVSYFSNGKVKSKGSYSNAVKEGKWVYYSPTGVIEAQEMWEEGKVVRKRIEPAGKERIRKAEAEKQSHE